MLVWEWADDETEDGGTNVPFLSLTCHIDRVTGVPGFGAAFAEVGWLLNNGDGAKFPNFARWNGETAKRRLKEASRKSSWRKRRDKCPVSGGTNVPTKPGPEKRREESVKTPVSGVSTKPKRPGVTGWRGQHFTSDHLKDAGRLMELWKLFDTGMVNPPESRLTFFALAEHALRKAKNPAAMFTDNVRHWRYDRPSQADEDAAQARLRQWDDDHR
jgi:hypothetical protein